MNAAQVRTFVLAALAVLLGTVAGHAACDPTTDPDKSDIANARAAVAANCPCTGATVTHGAYVSCAAQQASTVLTNKSCAGVVKKCAAHSTCGKPGAVTCCLTTATGTKCKIKRDAALCAAKQGATGSCTSCCDACPSPGTGPSCTTTTCAAQGQSCGAFVPCCGNLLCSFNGTSGTCQTCILDGDEVLARVVDCAPGFEVKGTWSLPAPQRSLPLRA